MSYSLEGKWGGGAGKSNVPDGKRGRVGAFDASSPQACLSISLLQLVTRGDPATHDWDVSLTFELGHIITGLAGVQLTRVIWVKPGATHPFVIVDAAMNDLARPALYDAYHRFSVVRPDGRSMVADIAGPVCETGDVFGIDRLIDQVGRGDLAVFHATGAYGAAMASSYNSRPVSPQVMVDGETFELVGDRRAPFNMSAESECEPWIGYRAFDTPLTEAA